MTLPRVTGRLGARVEAARWPTSGASVAGPLGSVLGIMLLAGFISAIPPAR